MWCWGSDGNGQLGNGAPTGDQVSPVQESTLATDWASVSAGNSHSCARKTNGTVWCWGSDGNGQLGNGATTGNQVSPVQDIDRRYRLGLWRSRQRCLLRGQTSGTLWCWGYGGNGQLGNGAIADQVSPVQAKTAATDWASVDPSNNHICARKTVVRFGVRATMSTLNSDKLWPIRPYRAAGALTPKPIRAP